MEGLGWGEVEQVGLGEGGGYNARSKIYKVTEIGEYI